MTFVKKIRFFNEGFSKVIKDNIDEEKRGNKTNELSQRELNYYKLTNRHFDELEKQINKMMKTVGEKRFFKKNIPKILDKIEKDKPGQELLTEKQNKNYKKDIEDFLKKKFKEGAKYTKCKLTAILLEHFLKQTHPNSEYDLLLFLKVQCILYISA